MIDFARIADILAQDWAYYAKESVDYRHAGDLVPDTATVLARALKGRDAVLDVGCGKADTLIANAVHFRMGVGIDSEPAQIELGRRAVRDRGVWHIRLLRSHSCTLPFRDAMFDVVFSERGPLGHHDGNTIEALRVLKPGGSLFYETIGEWNHWEVQAAFREGYVRPASATRDLEMERERLQRLGVCVQILASRLEPLVFADVYEWLKYQCSVWQYLGAPLPSAADCERFERFAAIATLPDGTVRTTYHTIWAGGSKE